MAEQSPPEFVKGGQVVDQQQANVTAQRSSNSPKWRSRPLGGSPLGLINVKSGPNMGGNGYPATFNDGTITDPIQVPKYNAGFSKAYASGPGNSLFSGRKIFRAWPDMSYFQTEESPGADQAATDYKSMVLGKRVKYKGTLKGGAKIADQLEGDVDVYEDDPSGKAAEPKQRKLHNNDVYDTSVLNIVRKLEGTRGSLRMADFAYLKNLGVYPNNRLVICRRFGGAVGDNIFAPHKILEKGKSRGTNAPYSTLITWVPQSDDFLNISFGEVWVEAEADFKDLLNRIGSDILGANTAGRITESLGNAIPLPGFTEIFQRIVLQKLGFISNAEMIPSGNPNLIKEAKRRKTIPYEQAGSGLSCTVSLELTFEYELKFITGLDPTLVWMDLLTNIVRFGTSVGSSYGLTGKLGKLIFGFLNDPIGFVVGVVKDIIAGIKSVITQLKGEIDRMAKAAGDAITDDEGEKQAAEKEKNDAIAKQKTDFEAKPENRGKTFDDAAAGKQYDDEERKDSIKQKKKAAVAAVKKLAGKVLGALRDFVNTAAHGIAAKYKIEIQGILAALSGAPSTPWHVTIGNPMRPVFCAGDMYTTDVKLKLGPTLAFNDLPSSITVNFTLTNARPWGLEEIMAKFNSGYLRSVDVQKSWLELREVKKTDEEGVVVTAADGMAGNLDADTLEEVIDDVDKEKAKDGTIVDKDGKNTETKDGTNANSGQNDQSKTVVDQINAGQQVVFNNGNQSSGSNLTFNSEADKLMALQNQNAQDAKLKEEAKGTKTVTSEETQAKLDDKISKNETGSGNPAEDAVDVQMSKGNYATYVDGDKLEKRYNDGRLSRSTGGFF